MARVKGRDTVPEVAVRKIVHRMGYRFRLHRPDLPGRPDIVMPKHRKVIFVHGCFWHGHQGCRRAARPTSNISFWERKLDGNIRRDKEALDMLAALGWESLVIWQCQTKDIETLKTILLRFLQDSEVRVVGTR
jgi:DNA mismatch endonuclease, patch repair protein